MIFVRYFHSKSHCFVEECNEDTTTWHCTQDTGFLWIQKGLTRRDSPSMHISIFTFSIMVHGKSGWAAWNLSVFTESLCMVCHTFSTLNSDFILREISGMSSTLITHTAFLIRKQQCGTVSIPSHNKHWKRCSKRWLNVSTYVKHKTATSSNTYCKLYSFLRIASWTQCINGHVCSV